MTTHHCSDQIEACAGKNVGYDAKSSFCAGGCLFLLSDAGI